MAGRTIRTLKKGEDWRPAFLKSLAATGNVGVACKAAKIGRSTAYEYRGRDDAFRSAWEDAVDDAVDAMEAEARRRAVQGTLKPIYQGGAKVGAVREYSDTLLIFLLKANRPEKFRDNYDLSKLASELALARAAAQEPAPGGAKGG